ncbi:MAG: Uncharacterised protein [Formosa sp. Hel1_33_131]|nr:MAG: Uncharacterised protein [Formosa sp. Hel1_33_131]
MKNIILSFTLLSFYCNFLNAQEIIDNQLLVRSSQDAITTFQTLDDSWLYTQWKNKTGVRKAYMGLDSTLTNFILGLENGANTFSIPSGNVGIGTTNPSTMLDVNGTVKASVFSVISSKFNSSLNSNQLQFSRNGPSYIDNKNLNGSIAIRTGGTENIDLLVNSDGNVGVGTTNPAYKLDVNGALNIKNGNTDLLIYRDSDVGDWSLLRTNTGNGIGLIGKPDKIAISVSRTSGNVGIGTTNPSTMLDVNGTVKASAYSVISSEFP